MTTPLPAFEDALRDTQTEPTTADEQLSVPVLIIGAGAAGARTAIELAERGVDSLVLGKTDHGEAHTTWAAGGINASLGSLDPEDSWEIHAADTIKEGHFINDPEAVELVTKTMPDRIRELEAWGMPFARTEDGTIDQRYFGAQSFRRTCFVGDRTGEAMLTALIDRAQALEIPYRENLLITKILSDGERAYGAVGYDMEEGHFVRIDAEHVVLAAAGYAAIYNRHSSRDDENTGDGPALALDAGAELMDLEFVQFHPTGMVDREEWDEEWSGRLVTEAVRGEGGRLYNADGERFMERYSPDQMELDARDVVARAIAKEVEEGRGTERGGVYLDISHKPRAVIEERLPKMYGRFADLGVDIAEEPMEVAPTAHYSMGGVAIDFETGATTVDNLYAVGEVTAGVHGANRLGGNSLAETVALGAVVGEHLAGMEPKAPERRPDAIETLAETHFGALAALGQADGEASPQELLARIREICWEHAGILRDEQRVEAGLEALTDVRHALPDLAVEGDRTSREFEFAIDLLFMLTVAEGVLENTRRRTESRGAHYRTDYPDLEESWQQNGYLALIDGDLETWTRSVGTPSEPILQAIEADYELEYSHLE